MHTNNDLDQLADFIFERIPQISFPCDTLYSFISKYKGQNLQFTSHDQKTTAIYSLTPVCVNGEVLMLIKHPEVTKSIKMDLFENQLGKKTDYLNRGEWDLILAV